MYKFEIKCHFSESLSIDQIKLGRKELTPIFFSDTSHTKDYMKFKLVNQNRGQILNLLKILLFKTHRLTTAKISFKKRFASKRKRKTSVTKIMSK